VEATEWLLKHIDSLFLFNQFQFHLNFQYEKVISIGYYGHAYDWRNLRQR